MAPSAPAPAGARGSAVLGKMGTFFVISPEVISPGLSFFSLLVRGYLSGGYLFVTSPGVIFLLSGGYLS